MTVDAAGNLFVVDDDAGRIRRIDAAGRITTVAGGGTRHDEGAPALETNLGRPGGIAAGAGGELYYSDTSWKQIRRISVAGTVTTVAGVGPRTGPVFSGDGGPALLADLYGPGDVALDPAGRLHFIDGQRVRRVDAQGIITTVAGGGTYPWGANGVRATDVQLLPFGLGLDGTGTLYIAETTRVRKVDAGGRISTIAGNGLPVLRRDFTEVDPGDGEPAIGVALEPVRLTVDAANRLYVTEPWRGRVRRIDPSGIIATVAGNGTKRLGGDGGPARHAQLSGPTAVVADSQANVYIADSANGRIRKVSPSGIITSLPQRFEAPSHLAIDGAGRLYVKVRGEVVLRVDPDGLVTRWVGGGPITPVPDGGRATSGDVWVGDVAVDRTGNVYVVEQGKIRRIDTAGIMTTVAGGGGATAEEGVLARSAGLYPTAVAVDSAGRVLFSDLVTQRIWRVTADARLTSVAGTTQGFSGDGGPATSAQLYLGIPHYVAGGALAVDPADQIFVHDFLNFRVRRIDAAGTITTVAGNGQGWDFAVGWPPTSGEGVPATSTPIAASNIAVDGSGNLYLVDGHYDRIRIVPGVASAGPPPSTSPAPAARAAAAPSTTTSTTLPATRSAPAPAPTTTTTRATAPASTEPAPAPASASVLAGSAAAAAGHRSVTAASPASDPAGWRLAALAALAASTTSSAWLSRRRRFP